MGLILFGIFNSSSKGQTHIRSCAASVPFLQVPKVFLGRYYHSVYPLRHALILPEFLALKESNAKIKAYIIACLLDTLLPSQSLVIEGFQQATQLSNLKFLSKGPL